MREQGHTIYLRAGELVEKAREFWGVHKRRIRQLGLALAIVVFGLGLYWSVLQLNGQAIELDILPCLLLIAVFQPLGFVFNAVSFRITAQMGGANVGWLSALRTIIYAQAANFLPIPAGLLTRVAVLRMNGVSIQTASSLTVLTTGLWGALAFGFAAIFLLERQFELAILAGAISMIGLVICFAGFAIMKVRMRLVGLIAFMRVLALIQQTFGILAAFYALGAPISFTQGTLLVISTFVGTAISIFPGGLGIREGTTALLAPLVGLDPATAFLSAALARFSELVLLAFAAGLIYMTASRGHQ